MGWKGSRTAVGMALATALLGASAATLSRAQTAEPPPGPLAQPCRSHPPYNDRYEGRYRADLAKSLAGLLPDPLTSCMPRGMPANMRSPDGIEFVVRPERVWIFDENGNQSRRI